MTDANFEERQSGCEASARRFGQNLVFFMIGGALGAAVALMFAPKRGSELRSEIVEMAGKRYDESIAAANELKKRTDEYYGAVKEAGSDVLNVVVEGATAVKDELNSNVEKIGSIIEHSAKRNMDQQSDRLN